MDKVKNLPGTRELRGLLDLRHGDGVEDLVLASLLEPVRGFLMRPAKQFRARLVELGFRLSGETTEKTLEAEGRRDCDIGAAVVEALHAGSLVVDDIQDGSEFRRGLPALHLKHGLPVALNAGNWLYFWPFEQIRSAGLDAGRELELYRLCHQVLLRAHFGQALDVGVPIDTLPRQRIASVCLAALELKTGALMELSMAIGARLGGASAERVALVSSFARSFGIALQMFDDIGNLVGKSGEESKRLEDLIHRRPSWIWAVAARELSDEDLASFRRAVDALPDPTALDRWLGTLPFVSMAKRLAEEYLQEAVATLEQQLRQRGDFSLIISELRQTAERLRVSYDRA